MFSGEKNSDEDMGIFAREGQSTGRKVEKHPGLWIALEQEEPAWPGNHPPESGCPAFMGALQEDIVSATFGGQGEALILKEMAL
ncbi:hypothetical protein [Devosia sp.]|uniref:hypothetical protein n=1 Tax=Devosia sp. TaxID=1871048 RepID=UPI002AFF36A1|nr:hypothetical protein [Devosia sp.]